MRGKAHSDETKAAVMAALLAGQGVSEVAKQYKLDASIVSRWKKQIPTDELQEVATKKGEDFGVLVADYLRETLITLAVQARFFRNIAWLEKQPADQLAVLHGVATDKAIRLLAAAELAGDPGGTGEGE